MKIAQCLVNNQQDNKANVMSATDNDKSKVYIALLHHQVYNRNKEEVTSAITNLDIHDIARIVKTYSLAGYFIVTPDLQQKKLAEKIINHWLEGYGSKYNFARGSALSLVKILPGLNVVIDNIKKEHGVAPKIFGTTAAPSKMLEKKMTTTGKAKELIETNKPAVIIFGTGWGLADSVLSESDYILPPINGRGKYNHLSVRAAAAIIIDRLFGNDL